ncbi:MAG: SusC/RagA family TonB-linked outer membrane protein [Alistipes sp.]|nr:SusC/RagA family TonB-linked outer membrane protein [Alistipes sp.]
MRKLVLSLFAVFCALSLSAQRQQITGTVTGDDGSPIVGATVVVLGTSTGTSTTAGGVYTITAPADGTLQFSFLGTETQEIQIGGRTTINVVLHSSAREIDDVIIIGYGTSTKATFTGSASSVSSLPTLKDLPVTSFEQALQGAAAGIQIGVPDGQPGGKVEVRIRGIGSVNASNQPLYVVDGVPVNTNNNESVTLAGYSPTLGVMNMINPSDIENITILKDAAATTIYGSRGANGVIMITTKKGRSGDLRVNLKSSWGFNRWAMNNRPMLGAEESRELSLEGAYNQALYNFNGISSADAWAWALAEVDEYYPDNGVDSDWHKALTRTGSNQIYDLSISGGNEKTSFYTSFGYTKDQGVYKGSDNEVYTAKGSLTHKSGNWTINYESYVSKMVQYIVSGQDGNSVAYANPYFASRTYLLPSIPIYNEDGTYNTTDGFSGAYYNLASELGYEWDRNTVYRFKNSMSVGYEFIPGLVLKETLSFDMQDYTGEFHRPPDSKNGLSYDGLTGKYLTKDKKLYNSLVLNYTTTINNDHNLQALIGWDVDRTDVRFTGAAGQGIASYRVWDLSNAAEPYGVYGDIMNDHLISYFGNITYNYQNKYYGTVTYRRDGSSRLGDNVKWANFWSASASWRISQEDFFNVDWVNSLRIRTSYGTTGTLPSNWYGAKNSYSYSGVYNGANASYPTRADNPDLSWEHNTTFDVGVEARLFDRWDIEVDFYNRKTTDLIFPVNLSLTTGFSSSLINAGSMLNRGVEVTTGVDVFNKEFKWYSQVILSHNKNKLTELYGGESIIDDIYLYTEGKPLYSIRSRHFAGIDPATGNMMWWDYTTDADGNLGERYLSSDPDVARIIVATVDPKLTGSWRNSFAYKGFDLDVLMTFSYGGNSWDAGWQSQTNGLYNYQTISRKELDRWQQPGDKAQNPKRMWGGGHGNYSSSFWVHSTDHLRLKQLTFGYTIPQHLTQKARMQNVRVYVAGTNLWTWAKYKDYDPEVRIDGQATFQIPPLKSITFGIEIGF